MIVNCPRSCDACELLDPRKRCSKEFLNMTGPGWWAPGDLDKMFERAVSSFPELRPEVLSRPPEGPWVVQFFDFVKEPEIEALLRWGRKLGYQRSSDVGTTNERGETTKIISASRTSSNAWCSRECEHDPMVQAISARTEQVTGVPQDNYESLQLLQYEVGQYYRTHHDVSVTPDGREDPDGPRILTFFLYLSDVDEGGETHFPRVGPDGGIKVRPVKGSAVLWPSVLNEDPSKVDLRTYHAALPVIKGKKYAANHWLHSGGFRKANLWGCTGSFD
jgi:prolyl 4-hydroxylase